MNFATNEDLRDTVNFEGYDYEVHDISLNGQTYPRYPYVVNVPFIAFTPGQLQSYLNN